MDNYLRKLNKQDLRDILEARRKLRPLKNGKMAHTPYRTIAKQYGVSHEWVREICTRKDLQGMCVETTKKLKGAKNGECKNLGASI